MRTSLVNMIRASVLFSLLSVAGAALADAPGGALDFNVDAKVSAITYHLVHKLHKFDGVSKNVQGRGRLLPSGQAQVMVRSPVESFDSGNVNRDAHMKETVDAARFPMVELKAAADGITMPTAFPATVEKTWKAQVTLHGVTQTLDIPVKLTIESDRRVKAEGSLKLSLESFKVERPELMFKKIDDEMKVDFSVALQR